MLTIERLKEVLDFDIKTNTFTWKTHVGCRGRAGRIAGHKYKYANHSVIGIDGAMHRDDRLAEFYLTGVYPDVHKVETASGIRGVTWNKRAGRWQVRVRIDDVQRHIGLYRDRDEASRVYNDCMKRLENGEEVWTPRKRSVAKND